MKPPEADPLADAVSAALSGPRYRSIDPGFARQVAAKEAAKGRRGRDLVKAVRNKLHQVGGAYLDETAPYERWQSELAVLPGDREDARLQDFSLRCMRGHASTRERLPILFSFFETILRPLAPIQSLLDLACGLNPLALPWMPIGSDCTYTACDIYRDMVDFINLYFAHIGQKGLAVQCNLVDLPPARPVQVALLLKAIPCLEQADKEVGARLLSTIQAEHLLVSFPAHSLGGRGKGMVRNYEARFLQLVEGMPVSVQRYEFPGELAFLLSRQGRNKN